MMENLLHDLFVEHRPRLFAIAYRMLGHINDAEDVLQDAWLRWQRCDLSSIDNPNAYLTQIVTRLSIDALRRVQKERVNYVGPWLPQPLIEDIPDGGDEQPAEALTALAQTLSIALLALLESLPPNERATFVLREAFEMNYKEIGACLNAEPATCRQWARRAKARLDSLAWRDDQAGVDPELLARFAEAIVGQDIGTLIGLLDQDVTLISDGGGKVAAATRTLHGPRQVSRFLIGIAERVAGRIDGRLALVNGDLGGLAMIDDELDSVYSISTKAGCITGIYIVRNPDKLASVLRPGS